MSVNTAPNWDDVLQCLNKYHSYNIRGKKQFDKNHIFDEDKSVKWNREEVVRQNETIAAENERLREEKSSYWKETVKLAIENIKYDFKQANTTISNIGAERLFNRLYCQYDGDIDAIEAIIETFTSALSEYDV